MNCELSWIFFSLSLFLSLLIAYRNQFLHSWKAATLPEIAVDRRSVHEACKEEYISQIKPWRYFRMAECHWPDLNLVETQNTRFHYNIYQPPAPPAAPRHKAVFFQHSKSVVAGSVVQAAPRSSSPRYFSPTEIYHMFMFCKWKASEKKTKTNQPQHKTFFHFWTFGQCICCPGSAWPGLLARLEPHREKCHLLNNRTTSCPLPLLSAL